MTSHSSKGYRTVKNLGANASNQMNFANPSTKLVNNTGIDTKLNLMVSRKSKKGFGTRA